MKLASVNIEQRLYNIECGQGYTCLGFDVMERKRKALADWLNIAHGSYVPGTQHAFDTYATLLEMAGSRATRTGERCPVELSSQLIGLEGRRVEVVDRKGDKPRRFKVGKSTGWMPCHIELANARSHGGIAANHTYYSVRIVR